MLIITVRVDRAGGQAVGIKEQIAMDLERYGDTRVISVQNVEPEQLKIKENERGQSREDYHQERGGRLGN